MYPDKTGVLVSVGSWHLRMQIHRLGLSESHMLLRQGRLMAAISVRLALIAGTSHMTRHSAPLLLMCFAPVLCGSSNRLRRSLPAVVNENRIDKFFMLVLTWVLLLLPCCRCTFLGPSSVAGQHAAATATNEVPRSSVQSAAAHGTSTWLAHVLLAAP